jgi:hypothetical protein
MDMRIIYHTPSGGIAVITPTGELPVEEVALKDVPLGVPFLIIPSDDVPPRDQRATWAPSFAVPHGHGLGQETWLLAERMKAETQGG